MNKMDSSRINTMRNVYGLDDQGFGQNEWDEKRMDRRDWIRLDYSKYYNVKIDISEVYASVVLQCTVSGR